MHQISGILLHMNLMDTNDLLSGCRLDLDTAISADWQIQLGDLVVLRVIRVKIVFTVKFTILGNTAVCGDSHCHCIFDYLTVQHRKGTRHTGTDRTGMCVWCTAECRGTAAEDFCFRC